MSLVDDKSTRYNRGRIFGFAHPVLSLALIQIEKYIRDVAFALLAQPLSSRYLRRVPNDIIGREKCGKVRGFGSSPYSNSEELAAGGDEFIINVAELDLYTKTLLFIQRCQLRHSNRR